MGEEILQQFSSKKRGGGRGIALQTYGGEIKSLVCQFEIFSLVILKHVLKILIYCSILAE